MYCILKHLYYLVLRHHLLDVLNGHIRSDHAQQIGHALRVVPAIVDGRRHGRYQPPSILAVRSQLAHSAAQEHRTPMNRMVGLVEHHRSRHHQCVLDDALPSIGCGVDLHIESCVVDDFAFKLCFEFRIAYAYTFVGTSNRSHVVTTARVATNEICENAHRHMRPVVLFDNL